MVAAVLSGMAHYATQEKAGPLARLYASVKRGIKACIWHFRDLADELTLCRHSKSTVDVPQLHEHADT
jgi:hypothetical protein